MRIGKHGTREVACVRYVELTKFACGQAKVEVDFANPGKMRQHAAAFLKQLKKETAEKYLADGNSLVWATIGLPCGTTGAARPIGLVSVNVSLTFLFCGKACLPESHLEYFM